MTRRALVTGASGGIGQGVAQALDAAGFLVDAPSHAYFDLSRNQDNFYADILVCCHAARAGATMAEALDTDVLGAGRAFNAVVAGMLERGFGRIVLFSSIRAHHPRPGQVAYATAKSAIEGLTRALAVEYGPRGILTNCVAPGAVLTPRTLANIAAGIVSEAELLERTPTGRLATVDDVARAVLWLVGDDCPVNGAVIPVDGGWSVSG